MNDIILKLAISALFGLIIGLERELKRKPLGLKTCMTIAVVGCLLTITSIEASFLYAKEYARPMDPGRIPSYILSGIGFLGAGVILRKSNDAISGLTTAALVWSSAGLGIAVGFGFYLEAGIALIFIIIGIEIIPLLMTWMRFKPLVEQELKAKISVNDQQKLTDILKEMKQRGIRIKRVKVNDLNDETIMDVWFTADKKKYTTEIYYDIHNIEWVKHVKCESV